MRLSTAADRDLERARAVVLAAIDGGATVLDTADAYALGENETGHNEALIAMARAARPDAAVAVMTKGGLTRPGGIWHADGRGRHLAAAAAASAGRLGAIDLYLLHAVDPRTPLATSVRALARLRDDGVVRAIGVCNVNRAQLEEALAIAELAAVQIELSPWRLDAVRGGVVELAAQRGLTVYAHRPLGGPAGVARLKRDPVLRAIAERTGATAAELALAWLRTLGVVPVPGPTRVETARSAIAAARLALDDADRAALDDHLLGARAAQVAVPRDGDVVIVMGMPGAGKSTIARELADAGYTRLNRDERGGTLAGITAALDQALVGGAGRVVLDNTYSDRAARAPVIEAARRHGLAVRCIVADTSLEDAQVNAAARMLERHGALLDRSTWNRASKRDPGAFGPAAQFNWRRAYEPPALDEGFAAIEHRAFTRAPRGTRRAAIVELDALVWAGRPATLDELRIQPGAAEALAAWAAAGWLVIGTAWRPPPLDAAGAALCAAVGAAIPAIADVAWCAHPAGPPVCWCRKPLPGLGLVLARAHDLDLASSMHVGRGAADRGFAARLGLGFVEAGATLPLPPA